MPADPVASGDVLRLEGVSGGYGNGLAIEAVDIAVPRRGVTCVLGRNGAGKSSLAKAILGLLRIEAGRITFDGVDVTAMPTHQRARAGIAWVAQEDGLFAGLTVLEHLQLVQRRLPSDADSDRAFALFPILAERVGVDAVRLSGGERKMLQLAMALATGPTLLVLDEPTEGVAPRVVEQLREVVAEQARDAAVLLIEQNLETAMALGGAGYVLEAGRVAAELDGAAMRSPDALREWVEL